jgi:protein arginine N-methyltransferase 1
MFEKLLTRIAAIVIRAYRRIAAVPFVRRIAYPLRNQLGFTNLYEHDKMLADHVRVDTYAAGIAKHVKPGDVVIDLGTGSGVLALLAARADARLVYAIDHSPFIASARRVAEDNGVSNVEFHQVHSGSFHAPTPVDVIVHEQIGEALFDERMVESIIDLRDRVLKPGGRIVPAVFELHLDPVQLIDDAVVPFAWEQRLHGIDFRTLEEAASLQPRRYQRRLVYRNQVSRRLCDPAPLFSIDLDAVSGTALPTSLRRRARVSEAGRVDGLCVSFVARFDDELYIDSSPFAPAERHPSSFMNPLLRVETMKVDAGEELEIMLDATDLATPGTWSWSCRRSRLGI